MVKHSLFKQNTDNLTGLKQFLSFVNLVPTM